MISKHEAGISKYIEAWSSGQIRLEKQKLYRFALLPPSRLAAFLNTSEFSARETPTQNNIESGNFKGRQRIFSGNFGG